MLKRLELINWESHKHTVIDCLSENFNAIVGRSDGGKSSILRALELPAYGRFDPESVRVGCKNTTVIAETDKGVVKVTRGDENLWEVTPVGQPKQVFNRPGRGNVPPLAAEVMGMSMVSLSGVDIPVNIMNQEETHFMLRSMGGKDASGSVRAQVIDEISGLSGIEEMIQAVSLDNSRAVREVNRIDSEVKKEEDKLPDIWRITRERKWIAGLSDDSLEYDRLRGLCSGSEELSLEYLESMSGLEAVEKALALLPSLEGIESGLVDAYRLIADAADAEFLAARFVRSSEELDSIELRISGLPQTDGVQDLMDEAARLISMAGDASSMMSKMSSSMERLASIDRSLEDLPVTAGIDADCAEVLRLLSDSDSADGMVSSMREELEAVKRIDESMARISGTSVSMDDFRCAEKAVINAREAFVLNRSYESRKKAISSVEESIQDIDKELEALCEEEKGLLSSIDVCPLTGRPVRSTCFEELSE